MTSSFIKVLALIFLSNVIINIIHAQVFGNDDLAHRIFYISNMIAGDEFEKLSYEHDQLELIDTIYARALQLHNYDISETLLTLTFTTLPFKKMPLNIPLIGIKLSIPLPSVSDSLFTLKVRNLPSYIFPDSKKNSYGDKDKLPHFYGNAFLSYNLRFFNFSKFIGILLELFEESFEVDGKFDRRDIKANHLGDFFGQLLITNSNILPSQVLSIYSLSYFKYIN